jgi:hypothetical protein
MSGRSGIPRAGGEARSLGKNVIAAVSDRENNLLTLDQR